MLLRFQASRWSASDTWGRQAIDRQWVSRAPSRPIAKLTVRDRAPNGLSSPGPADTLPPQSKGSGRRTGDNVQASRTRSDGPGGHRLRCGGVRVSSSPPRSSAAPRSAAADKPTLAFIAQMRTRPRPSPGRCTRRMPPSTASTSSTFDNKGDVQNRPRPSTALSPRRLPPSRSTPWTRRATSPRRRRLCQAAWSCA